MNYKNLPLLDSMKPRLNEVSYSDTIIIASQHILYSNYVMFSYLFAAGLKPENLFIIGKSYSTDNNVAKLFIDNGSYVHDYAYASTKPFDQLYKEVIKHFIIFVKDSANISRARKVIVLDDGGFLIDAINSGNDIKSEKVIAIEQTSSGFDKIKDKKIKFPVINVARSWLKLKYESPFIADAIVDQLYKKVQNKNGKLLIVGGGVIGSSIYNLLKNTFTVSLFDSKQEKSHISSATLKNSLCEYDLIIGCTGKTIISQSDYSQLKKGVTLMSASSSDREFDAVHLRRMVGDIKDVHSAICVNDITLINSGFPINFIGYEIEKKENIQLTRALMLAAIIQTDKMTNAVGINELDPLVQDEIALQYKLLLE